jgi:SAM-dependent methyltransferase
MSARPLPAGFKDLQRTAWSAAAEPWERWWRVFEAGAQRLNERLVAASGAKAGSRVLDVASGLGEPALTAARVVGPGGSVVGVDFAPDMVARARRRAAQAGAAHVRFVEADAELLDLPGERFDCAISRWGYMLMPDPIRALRATHAHLASGAPLALSWWAEAARTPFLAVQNEACHAAFGAPLPHEDLPGPMRFGRAGAMEERLVAAGFSVERVEELELEFRFAGLDECLDFEREMSSQWRKGVEDHGPAAGELALQRMRVGMTPFVHADGSVRLPGVVRWAMARA